GELMAKIDKSDWTDVELDEYGDFVMAADGDLGLVYENDALGQDIAHRVLTVPGSLPETGDDPDMDEADDPVDEYGAGLQRFLHSELNAAGLREMLRLARGETSKEGRVRRDLIEVQPVGVEQKGLDLLIRVQLADGSTAESEVEVGT
ncbi:MAG: hypothetical protein P9M14_04960, partial [Candidatus Alcyoniella australis]|nr:hypothetical protein [Candidatus Alcyoniella australis]